MKHLCILATWIFKIWYILCIGAIQVYADGITLKSSKDTSHWSLNVHTFPYNNQLLQMVQFLSDKKFGNSITVNLMYRNKQVFLHDCMLIVFPVKKKLRSRFNPLPPITFHKQPQRNPPPPPQHQTLGYWCQWFECKHLNFNHNIKSSVFVICFRDLSYNKLKVIGKKTLAGSTVLRNL